jgi:hypothetical protein
MVISSVIDVFNTNTREVTNHIEFNKNFIQSSAVNNSIFKVVTSANTIINYDMDRNTFEETELPLEFKNFNSRLLISKGGEFFIVFDNTLYRLLEDNRLERLSSFAKCAVNSGNFPSIQKNLSPNSNNILFSNCGVFRLKNFAPYISSILNFSVEEQQAFKRSEMDGENFIITVGNTLYRIPPSSKIETIKLANKIVSGVFFRYQTFLEKGFTLFSSARNALAISSPYVSQFNGLNRKQINNEIGNIPIRRSLFEQNYTLWVGTQGNGLHRLQYNNNSKTWLSAFHGLADSRVRTLYLDGQTLWIGTEYDGIYWLNLPDTHLNKLEVPQGVNSAFGFLPLDI